MDTGTQVVQGRAHIRVYRHTGRTDHEEDYLPSWLKSHGYAYSHD